jgi:predicted phage terminase large subunit-like protein
MRGHRETGSKYQRADLVAGAAERGEVKVVRGSWNREFLREVRRFPKGTHDDQVDALSGAYAELTGRSGSKVVTW